MSYNDLKRHYLITFFLLQGLIAAGRHGLQDKLNLPKPFSESLPIPKSLDDALICLQNDTQLCQLLGHEFVEKYVIAKRGNEIRPLMKRAPKNDYEALENERKMYFKLN